MLYTLNSKLPLRSFQAVPEPLYDLSCPIIRPTKPDVIDPVIWKETDAE